MATSSNHVCTLCHDEDVTNSAVTWCAECETFLCSDCDKHHRRIKATKQHKTVAIEDYNNLPQFVLKTGNRCSHHDKHYELFCPFHDCACCIQCISDNHKECRDMKQLSDVVKNVKTSAPVSRLTEDLRNLKSNFHDIGEFLKSRMVAANEQKNNGVRKIQQFRKLIDDHLDNLERELKERLESECFKMKANTEKMAEQVNRESERVEQLLDSTQKLLQFGTELQTYVAIKEIKNICDKENNFLQDLKNGDDLEKSEITVDMAQGLQSFLVNITCFEDIKVLSVERNLRLKEVREEQVQVTSLIRQRNPILKKTIQIPADRYSCNIIGCQILPNGQFLFVDQGNGRVLLFNSNGTYNGNVLEHKKINDICLIEGNKVAITLPEDKQIYLLEVATWRIIKTIKVKGKCYGLYSDGKALYVDFSERNAINVLDLHGRELNQIKIPYSISRFRVFDNQCYCTSKSEGCLRCYDIITGELLWSMAEEEIIGPFAIDIDSTGQLFVADLYNGKIIVISPDGKKCKVLLTRDDGIEQPCALNYNRQHSMLLVANRENGCAYLWQM